ncbi:MAG: hypothetical protein ACI9TY_001411 [Alphaproteobacteria bacterium]|jgi:hypothetical protein
MRINKGRMFLYQFIWTLIFFLTFPMLASAEQGAFKKTLHNGLMKYDYQWQDRKGDVFNTSFQLFASDIKRGMTEFKKFDEHELNALMNQKIKNFIKFNSPSGIKVHYNEHTEQMSFTSGRQTKIDRFMKRLEGEQEKVNAAYFKKRYYNYNAKNNSIRPAHGKIAKRYVIAMRPVAKALLDEVRGRSSREITNHVLHFIQSIPYDTLEDARSSNGAGFQTPYGLIHGNKGDCDSKSVMFAAIMRNIYPYARIVVIYVPGHALVGFDYSKGKNDYALQIEDTTFVLAEPVGPRMISLGQVTPRALSVMRQRKYSYEEIPY